MDTIKKIFHRRSEIDTVTHSVAGYPLTQGILKHWPVCLHLSIEERVHWHFGGLMLLSRLIRVGQVILYFFRIFYGLTVMYTRINQSSTTLGNNNQAVLQWNPVVSTLQFLGILQSPTSPKYVLHKITKQNMFCKFGSACRTWSAN